MKTVRPTLLSSTKIALALTIFFMPLNQRFALALAYSETFDPNLRSVAFFYPLDVVWAVLTLLAIPFVVRSFRNRDITIGFAFTLTMAVTTAIAYIVNPSPLGLSYLLHGIGAFAVVAVISHLSRTDFRIFVAAPLLATATVQATLALTQVFYARTDGISRGPWFAGTGTLYHPYILSGILLVAVAVAISAMPDGRWRPLWLASIAVSAAGIATGFSRAAAVSLAAMIIAYAWGWLRRQRNYRSAFLVTALPSIGTAAVLKDGWLASWTAPASGVVGATNGRLELFGQAVEIAASSPIVGVGPGRYLQHLAARYPSVVGTERFQIVHGVPLTVAAETGVVAGVLFFGFFAVLAIRAFITSPVAVAVFSSLGAYILLDKFTYANSNGVLLFAVWIAALDILARYRKVDESAT